MGDYRPVNVVLLGGREVVVDDERDLLDVDTTGEEVGGDEDPRRARAELLHDDLALALLHVTVCEKGAGEGETGVQSANRLRKRNVTRRRRTHGRDGELALGELLGEPVDLAAGVAEDDGLGDGDGLVEVRQGVELPVLLLDGDVELADTLERELVLLDENADRVAHELLGDLEDVLGHGGREEDDLRRREEEQRVSAGNEKKRT
jgi:hypothetical protein